MEAHVVVGTVVAFVVAQDEHRPEDGVEFGFAKSAMDHPGGGVFFKKILRYLGGFSYAPGIHEGMRVRMKMYGLPCRGCGTMTWWEALPHGRPMCDECTDAHQGVPVDISEIEYFDQES